MPLWTNGAPRIRAWMCGGQPADCSRRTGNTELPPRKSRDVYRYFDNDAKVKAPSDVMKLCRRLQP
jgi:hypothetical protein